MPRRAHRSRFRRDAGGSRCRPRSHSVLLFRHSSDERNPTDVTGGTGTMKPHVSGITLGVKDMNRAKQFYSKGLGWPIQQDYQGQWVSFSLNNGSSTLGLRPWIRFRATLALLRTAP